MDNGHGDVEQFSDESRRALSEATRRLIENLQAHTSALLAMRGGSAEIMELFESNADIAASVRAWDDAIFDHTGTTAPLAWTDEDEDDDEDEDEPEDTVSGEIVSVVSRFDLLIDDADAVLTAGRAAHRRLWPDEEEQDAQAAVSGVANALYAIGHEAGDPWFDVPGIEPLTGERVFLALDAPYEQPPDEPESSLTNVAAPPGSLIYSESWR